MTGLFPARHTVLWFAFDGEGEDELGNDVESWAEEGVPRKVIDWQPTRMSEVLAQGNTNFASRSITYTDLHIPPDFGAWGVRDKVKLPNGDLYEVDGGSDLSGAWHGWHPGDVIRLKKVS